MKIIGVNVDMLLELDSETYIKHVVFENGKKVIYVVVLRAIPIMLLAALLLYKKFCGDLENIGFEFNPHNPCVANKIKVGKQHTVILHVGNIMSSHVNPKVDDRSKEWMNHNYGNHGEVKANRGKLHKYLGLEFYFTEKGKVKINMENYVERMIHEFPMKTSRSDTDLTPDRNNIFENVTEKFWVKKKLKSSILQ